MKLVFFSSDPAEVDLVHQEFLQAGIACEVRARHRGEGGTPGTSDAEIWIRHDADSHRAALLCVQLGVGFAKRAARPLAEFWD